MGLKPLGTSVSLIRFSSLLKLFLLNFMKLAISFYQIDANVGFYKQKCEKLFHKIKK
jgi:hypothetical protein